MTATPQPGGDIARALDAVRKIVRALRLSSRAVEKDVGISGAQLFVLQQLALKPAESVNELAERTLTHQSTVSVVVARLEQRGLVTRTPSPEDARRTRITASPDGLALLERAPATVQARLASALRNLPEEQLRGLAEGLDAWLREAGIQGEEPGLFFEDDGASARPRRAPFPAPLGRASSRLYIDVHTISDSAPTRREAGRGGAWGPSPRHPTV